LTDLRPDSASPSEIFLLLILAQAAHSLEECRYRLFDIMPPARLIGDAIGPDRATGFAIANVVLVLFGFGCWVFAARNGGRAARTLMFGWAILEIANGIGHLLFAGSVGGYFPGAATAPLLLILGVWLVRSLSRKR